MPQKHAICRIRHIIYTNEQYTDVKKLNNNLYVYNKVWFNKTEGASQFS